MADLREFVKQVVRDMMKTEYPHARRPSCVAAKIIRARQEEENYHYTLRLLDSIGNEDTTLPEVPYVFSDGIYKEGEKVVVVYVNGQMPFIIGRWLQ